MDIFNVTLVDFVLFQKYSSRVISAGDVIANSIRMEKTFQETYSHMSPFISSG